MMQKKEAIKKGLFKKIVDVFFDFEWSDKKIKDYLLHYDENILIQGLEAGKFTPNRVLFNQTTILNEAIKYDLFDFTKKLIELEADVNKADSNGKTPVMWVVDGWWNAQNRKFWPLLKKAGADFNKPDINGYSPILCVFDALNKDESIPVFQMKRFDCLTDQIAYLIKFGADVNFQDKEGNTCLMKAIENGFFVGAKILINRGADLLIKNKAGEDAYHFAMKKGELQIAKMIQMHLKEQLKAKHNQAVQLKAQKSPVVFLLKNPQQHQRG